MRDILYFWRHILASLFLILMAVLIIVLAPHPTLVLLSILGVVGCLLIFTVDIADTYGQVGKPEPAPDFKCEDEDDLSFEDEALDHLHDINATVNVLLVSLDEVVEAIKDVRETIDSSSRSIKEHIETIVYPCDQPHDAGDTPEDSEGAPDIEVP